MTRESRRPRRFNSNQTNLLLPLLPSLPFPHKSNERMPKQVSQAVVEPEDEEVEGELLPVIFWIGDGAKERADEIPLRFFPFALSSSSSRS